MKEQTTTYGELKIRKQELRDEMNDDGNYDNIGEYRQVIQAIKDAEWMLLWSITPDEAYGELEKPNPHKGVNRAIIVAGILAVITILFLVSSCQTLKGATGDGAWILQKLSDNIQTQEK